MEFQPAENETATKQTGGFRLSEAADKVEDAPQFVYGEYAEDFGERPGGFEDGCAAMEDGAEAGDGAADMEERDGTGDGGAATEGGDPAPSAPAP